MPIEKHIRQDIFDHLRMNQIDWFGRLSDAEFLSRIWDLSVLPSTDNRFSDAAGDIWQHRENNPYDWDDDWVYSDRRFNLLSCDDERFLEFLCTMLHPLVRPDGDEAQELVAVFNGYLSKSDYEITPSQKVSTGYVYTAQHREFVGSIELNEVVECVPVENPDYITKQITRMESSINDDPELAIGTAKEFVETVCKSLLDKFGVEYSSKTDLPRLVRLALKQLDLVPESIPDKAKASNTIKTILMNFAQIVDGMSVVRNSYGTGHGKNQVAGLETRHARLVVNAAKTLVSFIVETHQSSIKPSGNDI